jgi:hypothetical protein
VKTFGGMYYIVMFSSMNEYLSTKSERQKGKKELLKRSNLRAALPFDQIKPPR